MREWTVEGTDRDGAVKKIKVRAQDEDSAAVRALERGVNATAVYVEPGFEYETPAPALATPAATKSTDRAAETAKAGKRLRAADTVLATFGGVLLVLSIVFLCMGLGALGS